MNALGWALRTGRSGRGRMALAVVLGVAAASSAIGLAATSAWLISRASEQPPVLHLMVAIVAVRTFGIARGVFRYLERLVGHDASLRLLGEQRVTVVRRLEQLLPGRRRGLSSGELLARFVDDVDALADLWARVLLPYAVAAIVGAATVVFVALLLPAAGVVLAVTLLVAAVAAPVLSSLVARRAARRTAPARGAYQAEVVDLLGGAAELAVCGALGDRLERLDTIDVALARAEARTATGGGVGTAVAMLAAGAAVGFAFAFGVEAVAAGALEGVVLAVVVLTPLAAHELFSGLAPSAHLLPHLARSAERVLEVLDQDEPVVEPPVPAPLPAGPYGLRLVGLRARWDDDQPDVLRSVDLEVAAGATVVVEGPSGAGKSTLAAVLLRFLDPSAGSVELVGSDAAVDLRCLAGDDVRSVVGWCAQDAHVFDSTIEANLRLARPGATPAELWRALEGARLDAWVASLPDGLATMVGEHGGRLSGGQRQRLSLARVLLADRPVVVFDEPTEHLDPATATAVMADLLGATRGRTVLLVTHRADLVPTADRVVTLDGGRVRPGRVAGTAEVLAGAAECAEPAVAASRSGA